MCPIFIGPAPWRLGMQCRHDQRKESAMRRCSVYPSSPKVISPVFVLFWLIAWCVVASGTAWGGTLKGTVRFTGAAVEQKKLLVTVDHSVCGKEKDAQDI